MVLLWSRYRASPPAFRSRDHPAWLQRACRAICVRQRAPRRTGEAFGHAGVKGPRGARASLRGDYLALPAFKRVRSLAAYPSLFSCFTREIASASGGTSLVTVVPVAT